MALDLAQLCCAWESGGQLDSLDLHFPLLNYQRQPAWWQQRSGGLMPALTGGGLLPQVVAAVAAEPGEPHRQAQTPAPSSPPSLEPAPAPAVARAPATADTPPGQGTGVVGVAGMAQCHTSSWREVPAGSRRFCLLLGKQLDNQSRLLLSGK